MLEYYETVADLTFQTNLAKMIDSKLIGHLNILPVSRAEFISWHLVKNGLIQCFG